jgi:hypothetical protein
MSPTFFHILIALFLIAHGVVHAILAAVPVPAPGEPRTPFFPSWWRTAVDPLWPILRTGTDVASARRIGWGLWVVQLACFVLAGLGLMGFPGLAIMWRGLAVFGASTSLMVLALYWHPRLVLGVVINLAILAGYILSWPPFLFS